jgi:hypothetical protein
MNTAYTPEEINRLARKRAGAKMGWYVHAAVYLVVNTGLAAISIANGQAWFIFPALGWGLGLLIHGVVVFAAGRGSPMRERMIQKERERLMAQRDAS